MELVGAGDAGAVARIAFCAGLALTPHQPLVVLCSQAVKTLNPSSPEADVKTNVEALLAAADTDNDGKISFDEFKAFVGKYNEKHPD